EPVRRQRARALASGPDANAASPSARMIAPSEESRMRRITGLAAVLSAALLACAQMQNEDPSARALRIHREAIVVDPHADTTPHFQDPDWDFAARHPKSDSDIDLPRAREGGLDVQFWSIYVGKVDGDGRAIREAMERIDSVWEMARRHPNDVVVATDVAGI